MKACFLKTNDRVNPMGIDTVLPSFRWSCEGGTVQTAYRVVVSGGEGTLWDSGKVKSHGMSCIYGGVPLASRQRCSWSVTLWDEKDTAKISEPASFEIGLLENWQAKWICGIGTDLRERLPADCFRKEFTVSGNVRSARLYATACGVYAPTLNGTRLPGVLAPGTTQYDRRLYAQTYDITDLLQAENTLDIALGDGWFKGKIGSTNEEYFFGSQLKLLAQVVITYADGSEKIIGSDESWKWCNDGPIRYADLKDGEVYDARQQPTYSQFAQAADYPIIPTPSPAEMIAEQEVFHPVLLKSPSGADILDFGQNLAGYIRFRVPGHRGQVIRLRMTETLDHGEYTDITVRAEQPEIPTSRQEIIYTCVDGENVFQPEFFYSGFRYALVEGMERVEPRWFEAVAVYSDLDFTGSFVCSNEMLNQFVRNTLWSMKGNFVDVPTDCPQREKSGWTGDAQIFVGTASCFADTAAFYRKWLRDVRDCQREDGRVDNVCPKIRGVDRRDILNGSSGWADAAVIIPYTLWKRYADDRFIWDNYELMHGWKEYAIASAADKTYYHLPDGHPLKAVIAPCLLEPSEDQKYLIESGVHWGEWCEPGVDSAKELLLPKQELTAAYLSYSMGLLAQMLQAIGKESEAAQCREYADGARRAYNRYFVNHGHIAAPRQAPMVRALALGMLEEVDQKSVAADLNADAIARNYTVGTGFLSTPFVLKVLAENGYADTAYRMLENTAAPSWLAMVCQGASTVWEEYECYDSQRHPLPRSMNHYSPGAVCQFLFETVCGIRIDGENHFTIAPVPGGTLTHARAEYRSPFGTVCCGWKKEETGYSFSISVPANTSARIILPDGRQQEVVAGQYSF